MSSASGPLQFFLLFLVTVAFLGSVVYSILVLRSGRNWVFTQSPSHILEDYLSNNPDMPISEVYASLARFLEENVNDNEDLLSALLRKLNLAFALTALQVFVSVAIIAAASWSTDMTTTQPQPQPSKPAQQPSQPAPPQPPSNPGRRVERQDDTPIEKKGRK